MSETTPKMETAGTYMGWKNSEKMAEKKLAW